MRNRLRSLAVWVFVGGVVALATTYAVKASPEAGQPPDPMTALLAEVHGLRLAMERSASVAPRVQLTLARLTIEEQRLTVLATQLDQVRRELTATMLESQKIADRIPEIEKSIPSAADDRLRGLVAELAALKREANARGRQEQQLRARENEAAQAVSTEQARWMDINARLDELERLLGPMPR